MFCDKKNDIEKFDLNIDERIVVVYFSSSKAYRLYKKVVMWFFDESGRVEKLQKKEDCEMEGLLQIQRDSFNSELAEEHSLHECSNLKEADADDKHDEVPGPLDSTKQRWCISNW